MRLRARLGRAAAAPPRAGDARSRAAPCRVRPCARAASPAILFTPAGGTEVDLAALHPPPHPVSHRSAAEGVGRSVEVRGRLARMRSRGGWSARALPRNATVRAVALGQGTGRAGAPRAGSRQWRAAAAQESKPQGERQFFSIGFHNASDPRPFAPASSRGSAQPSPARGPLAQSSRMDPDCPAGSARRGQRVQLNVGRRSSVQLNSRTSKGNPASSSTSGGCIPRRGVALAGDSALSFLRQLP
jgi:hypothetical protein